MEPEHVFWVTSRAAGVVALLASSAAVTLGLLMGGRLVRGRTGQLRVAHEALALATIAALAVHAFALLGDGYLSPSLADVTIPFVSGYERLWTTTGIVGGWILVVLGLSYYAAPPHRRGALARAAPVHRARLAARRAARAVRGHRRGHAAGSWHGRRRRRCRRSRCSPCGWPARPRPPQRT